MVAITATNSATPSLQATLSQTRLRQARREADQAEATAQGLRAQADNAESAAQGSHGRVRTMAANVAFASPTYQAKRETGRGSENQDLMVDMYQRFAALSGNGGNPLQGVNLPNPVQNAQGQTIGRIVNLRV